MLDKEDIEKYTTEFSKWQKANERNDQLYAIAIAGLTICILVVLWTAGTNADTFALY